MLGMSKYRMWRALPRKAVHLDTSESATLYRLRYGWDGDIRVTPQDGGVSGRFVLVLDTQLPFRRRFQLPKGRHYRRQMAAELAAQLFPFPQDRTRYAQGNSAGEPCIFALPQERLEELLARLPKAPDAVLVAEPKPAAIHQAIDSWVAGGPTHDLLAGSRVVPRSLGLSVLLAGALAGTLIWAIADIARIHGQRQAQQRALSEALFHEAAGLSHKLRVIAHMNEASRAVQELTKGAGSRVLPALEATLAGLPDNVELSAVDFDGQGLTITGWDPHDLTWVNESGLRVEVLKHEPLPERDYFVLRVAI